MVRLMNRRPLGLLLVAVVLSALAVNGLLDLVGDLATGTGDHALMRGAGVLFLYRAAVAAFRRTHESGAHAVADELPLVAQQQ